MAGADDRFVKVYKQGGAFSTQIQVWVDKATGVNYMIVPSGYGIAVTPLLNRDGTPIVTPISPFQGK